MHRNARKLDEGTNRLLLQLCNEQDLLGRSVQASMHIKLAMEHQIGRQLTAKDPTPISGYWTRRSTSRSSKR
jgi:hypothetical protein